MSRTSRKSRTFRPTVSDSLEDRVVPSAVSAAQVQAFRAERQVLIQHREALLQHRRAELMARRQAILSARTNVSAHRSLAGQSAAAHRAALVAARASGGVTSYGYGYAARLRRAHARASTVPSTTAATGHAATGTGRLVSGVAGLSGTPSTADASANGTTNLAGTTSLSGLSNLAGTNGIYGPNRLVSNNGPGGASKPNTSGGLNSNLNGALGRVNNVTGQLTSTEPIPSSGLASSIYGPPGPSGSAYSSLLGSGVGYAMGSPGIGSYGTGMAGRGVAGTTTTLAGPTSVGGVAGTAGLGTATGAALGTSAASIGSSTLSTTTGTGSATGPYDTSAGALHYGA